MKETKTSLKISLISFTLFTLWTLTVKFYDIDSIGPDNSSVGLSKLNQLVHQMTGVNFVLYNLTDWLGLVPIIFCLGFGVLGLVQLIKRKSIFKVDFDILTLGGFYIVTLAIFLLFENVVINYRPVLINGYLEPSYPSSTTLLTMCVMPTAAIQLKMRVKPSWISKTVLTLIIIFVVFMVIVRLISGVHWFTDIVGGVLLSLGLVTLYYYVINIKVLNASIEH